jgi:hypothetical protein
MARPIRGRKRLSPDEIEAEIIDLDAKPRPEPEPKVPPVTSDFRDEVYNLTNCVQAFKDVVADERFPRSAKRIAKEHMEPFGKLVTNLEEVYHALFLAAK